MLDNLTHVDRSLWDSARMQAYISLAPHMKRNSKIKVEDLWPLPWDPKQEKKMSQDDANSLLNIGASLTKIINKK